MAKLNETIEEARAKAPAAPLTADQQRIRELEARLARLEAAQNPAQQRPAAVQPKAATLPKPPPVHYRDGRYELGDPGEGKGLWEISLPGLRPRVVDPERETATYLDSMYVWATNEGEAWMLFVTYNGNFTTSRVPSRQLIAPAA